MRNLTSRFLDLFFKHYFISTAISVVTLIFFGYYSALLPINSDQLSLMPPELPHVREAKKVNEMLGGFGYLILTIKFAEKDQGDQLFLKATELAHQDRPEESRKLFAQARAEYQKNEKENRAKAKILKKVADELNDEIKNREELRFVRYKVDLEFLLRKAYFYMNTEDLAEVLRRARIKRAELIEKADPFYIELEEKKDYQFDVADILAKYKNIGDRQMFADNYFLSPDQKMLIMLLKPKFSLNEIDKATRLLDDLGTLVKSKGYDSKLGVEINFTGTYVQFLDNYRAVRKSLEPAMIIALVGIALILGVFVRRKRLIAIMLVSLIYAIVITFGATYFLYGELNLLTSMFGGILAGLGIDFGIHFVFRFCEEYGVDHDLHRSNREAILKTGGAAFFSATTTGAAFLSLIFSGFRGFSEFGVISALGIAITAVCMFLLTPLQLVLIGRYFPRFLDGIEFVGSSHDENSFMNRLNWSKLSRWILVSSVLALILTTYWARNITFEYDTRRMVALDLPSKELYEEIGFRYELAGDPLVIASPTLDEASSLWDFLNPLPEEYKKYVVRINSIFNFVPDRSQQGRNYALVQQFHGENADIKIDMIPERYRGYYGTYMDTVREKPFGPLDLPDFLLSQFRNLPDSKETGWLTLVSPSPGNITYTWDLQGVEKMIGTLYYPVVSRHNIRALADYIPTWENRHGRIKGDRTSPGAPRDSWDLALSDYEKNGVLEIANNIDEKTLDTFFFTDLVKREILTKRPFDSIEKLQATKLVARTTGGVILVAQFTEIIERESKNIIIGTVVIVILVLIVSFRNATAVVLSLIPLFCGMVFTLGLLALLDIRINYFNLCVIPVIIGYGINNGIFLYHRYLETGSVVATLKFTGAAVTASSLTTLAGWGSLAVAFHVGLKSMGTVANVGIGFMMVTSLTILPAILQLLTEFRQRKADVPEPVPASNERSQ